MSTQRQSPRPKSRTVGSQPASQQSSPQSMKGHDSNDRDRQHNALENQGSQGKHVPFSLREEEDDDSATRH